MRRTDRRKVPLVVLPADFVQPVVARQAVDMQAEVVVSVVLCSALVDMAEPVEEAASAALEPPAVDLALAANPCRVLSLPGSSR